jgi:hypothetical protein
VDLADRFEPRGFGGGRGVRLGAEIRVPSLDGPVTVTLKPGMGSGRRLRPAGKGLPRRRDVSASTRLA